MLGKVCIPNSASRSANLNPRLLEWKRPFPDGDFRWTEMHPYGRGEGHVPSTAHDPHGHPSLGRSRAAWGLYTMPPVTQQPPTTRAQPDTFGLLFHQAIPPRPMSWIGQHGESPTSWWAPFATSSDPTKYPNAARKKNYVERDMPLGILHILNQILIVVWLMQIQKNLITAEPDLTDKHILTFGKSWFCSEPL